IPVTPRRCPHDDWSCGCADEDGLGLPWFISFFIRYLDYFFASFVYGSSALVSTRTRGLLCVDGTLTLFISDWRIFFRRVTFTPQVYEPNED
ncbi:MAG: hypothetical protein L7S70_03915, partial [Pseudomonadales bacterium]|nr:hypothetical protein [Pseudomonadales bacterium]